MRSLFIASLLVVVGCGAGTGTSEDAPVRSQSSQKLEVATEMLGEARMDHGTCGASSTKYDVVLATGRFTAWKCVGGNMSVTLDRTLTADERAKLDTQLDALKVASMPGECGFDGRAYALTLDGKQYFDADYNCTHRTDVGYRTPGIGPIVSTLGSFDTK